MRRLLRRWREQRSCFHHDISTGASWIVDDGFTDYRKKWYCQMCKRGWVL